MKKVFTLPGNAHGSGPVFFAWQTSGGNYLVTTGYDNMVNIYDRHGERQDQIQLLGMCSGLSWDKDGDILCAICDHSPVLVLWDSNSRKVSHVDSGLRDMLTFVLWSKSAGLLAVGTSKGNLLIYNHWTSKKVPILGKHSKQITCGAWSEQNYIALVGNDKMLTVSNADGDTLCQTNLKAEPSLVQFSSMKQDSKCDDENTVSLILNKKSLYLLNIHNPDNPIVLAFQEKYGSVVDYKWYGDGYILLAFSNGFFVVISTHLKEIGQELTQISCFKENLVHMAACLSQNKVAACGENIIKIYDLADMQDVLYVITEDDERSLDWIEWSDDGQLLAVSGTEGSLHVYLTSLPILGGTSSTHLAVLTSLREVSIYHIHNTKLPLFSIKIDIEPTFFALGPYHIAVGMNNRTWFYRIHETVPVPIHNRQYLGTVQNIKLNAKYASALIEGKIQLHNIYKEQNDSEERESQLFPDNEFSNMRITCHALTNDFLIFATDIGAIQYFSLSDWRMANGYNHIAGIKQLFPDPCGTRVVVFDDKNSGFIYNPVNDGILNISDFPTAMVGVLWDISMNSKGTFLAHDEQDVYTYVYSPGTIEGPKINHIEKVKLQSGNIPLMFLDGEITCQMRNGKTTTLSPCSHSLIVGSDSSEEEKIQALNRALALRRFRDAWNICMLLNDKKHWDSLGREALYDFDINFAIHVYRHIENAGMVWSLKSIKDLEDRNLIGGYLAILCVKHNLAQELFLSSGTRSAALQMRKNLLQWDLALKLAERLDPSEIPYISREYAQQLEFMGEHSLALQHYERSVNENGAQSEHNEICSAGIARTSIRCSDLRKGIHLASQLKNQNVKKECAEILEEMKQLSDAAYMYECGGFYDKSAWLYLKLKNWNKVQSLLPHITSPKVWSLYAKAKEAEGAHGEAVKAYTFAQDFDNAIRIHLDMQNLDEAVKIAKDTKSEEGAKMIAKFFEKINDAPSAITFLVISKCNDQAFHLAQSTAKMDIFADAIGNIATSDEYISIASYYENERKFFQAGKFFILGGKLKKAVNLLIQVTGSESDEAIKLAVQAIGSSGDEQLTQKFISFLMGETDGMPKDFKHLFQLYMALKRFREAGKTAMIIAREEQTAGNYRNAHDVLSNMCQELKRHNIEIPAETFSSLMLLHSYVLAKIYAKSGNHMNSARLLIRITEHISKFPCHTTLILTTAVLECLRAGLKKSAFNFAATLMRPENRCSIDPKFKKMVETVIRKPQREEIEETASCCPYCGFMVADSHLSCPDCRNSLPFCIVTGYHIVKEDLTVCPKCNFLALCSKFKSFLEKCDKCPMCLQEVDSESIVKINDTDLLHPQAGD